MTKSSVLLWNIINPAQFGFLQHRSTLHQLLTFTKYISDSFKNNAQTDVIYLDFKKALDSVAHNELLAKLWSFGITGTNWKWFQAYLTSRRQCVHFNNITSELLPVLSGVPQGSVLGPILFLVFVNDLPDSILSSQVTLFADDTKCFKSVHSLLDSYSLQQDILRLSLWSRQWTLNFNEQTCVVMSFSPKSPAAINNTYFINSESVHQQDHHRDLGIIMSSDLSWSVHYCHILSNAYKMLHLLRQIFSTTHCPQNKRALYVSLIKSKLMYNSPLWRPQFIKDIANSHRTSSTASNKVHTK